MINQRFGKLVVLIKAGMDKNGRNSMWSCLCDCGKITAVSRCNLRTGHTKSCGCFKSEACSASGKLNMRHGHARHGQESPTWQTWRCMRARCYDTKNPKFRLYGLRGIQVCARWFDFENFLADMGERPSGKTIDRINGESHYMPSNCRWATPLEQRHNRAI